QGLSAHQKLVTDFPTRDPEYHRRLGSNYEALMNLLRGSARPQEAVQLGRQAIDFYDKLAAKQPNELNIKLELAKRYASLGGLFRDRGKRKEVVETYRLAIGEYQTLLTGFPEPSHIQEFMHVVSNLANLLKAAGQPIEAEKVYRQAISFYEKLSAEQPNVPE